MNGVPLLSSFRHTADPTRPLLPSTTIVNLISPNQLLSVYNPTAEQSILNKGKVMKSAVKTNRAIEVSLFRIIFLVAGLGTITIATNFLDPINLPKLIAILVPIPWLVLYLSRTIGPVKSFGELVQDRLRIIFLISIFSILLLALFSPVPLERRLLGTWGRNNGLLTLGVSVLLSWGAYEISKKQLERIKVLKATLLILIPTAVYGLIQVVNLDPIAWSSGSMKIFATFGNTNFAAAAWGLGAIVSVALFIFDRPSERRKRFEIKQLYYVLSFISFAYLSYMTKSIQGLFAIATFFTLILIFKLLSIKSNTSRIVSVIVLMFSAVIAQSIFFNGPLTSLISSAGSLGFRKIYWDIGLGMFFQNPVLGSGIDSFGDYYRNVRDSEMAKTTSIDLVVNNAHNTFIQASATLGIFGILTVILPVFLTLLIGLLRILREPKFDINSSFFAIFISLWLMASFSIDNISITLWNWIFLGFALGGVSHRGLTAAKDNLDVKTKRARQPQPSLYDFGKVLATLLSISIFFFGWTSASADRKIVSALRTPASFSQPETINARLIYLGDISRLRVLDPQHYLTIARALVELQQIPQSIEVLSKGVAEYPRDFALWDSLAYSLEQQSRIPEAVLAREKQLTLDPRHARVWSYLAQDYLKNNDLINAKEAAKKSLENLPIFALEDQNSIKNFLMQLNLI